MPTVSQEIVGAFDASHIQRECCPLSPNNFLILVNFFLGGGLITGRNAVFFPGTFCHSLIFKVHAAHFNKRFLLCYFNLGRFKTEGNAVHFLFHLVRFQIRDRGKRLPISISQEVFGGIQRFTCLGSQNRGNAANFVPDPLLALCWVSKQGKSCQFPQEHYDGIMLLDHGESNKR